MIGKMNSQKCTKISGNCFSDGNLLEAWKVGGQYAVNVIAYDIASPRRLRRVARTCELYGVRLEKSLFKCCLTEKQFEQFWSELIALVDDNEDFLLSFPINAYTIRDIRSIGHFQHLDRQTCFVCGIS